MDTARVVLYLLAFPALVTHFVMAWGLGLPFGGLGDMDGLFPHGVCWIVLASANYQAFKYAGDPGVVSVLVLELVYCIYAVRREWALEAADKARVDALGRAFRAQKRTERLNLHRNAETQKRAEFAARLNLPPNHADIEYAWNYMRENARDLIRTQTEFIELVQLDRNQRDAEKIRQTFFR